MRTCGHASVSLAFTGISNRRLEPAGAGRKQDREGGSSCFRDAFRAKKGSENRSLFFAARPAPSRLLFAQPCGSARGSGRLGHHVLQRLEALPGKFAVEFANLLRFGDEGRVSLLGKFGLKLDGL